ncbi:B3 domain-containing protein [Prunus yedoensis var. nudiflora]|uniref:B3 domain-containing protein n=1 Tax=Prunus yedoensis var. nudiflora TaxID=2094558 RepID=A0A314YEN8_PRUYE|nr:B3 domain-containing protein [Prunus yedoensis var. nudiflora]
MLHSDKDNAETGTVACNDATRKRAHSPPSETQKKKKDGLQPVEQSEDDSEEVDSEVLEESKSQTQLFILKTSKVLRTSAF